MKHFTAYSEAGDKRVDLHFNSLEEAKEANPTLKYWSKKEDDY
jgi:hypothetical protein